MKHWTEKLIKLEACTEAVQWAKKYPTIHAAWVACERPDWMLWVLNKSTTTTKDVHHTYVRIACAAARLALPYTQDARVLGCIEVVEGWERGEKSLAEVMAARAAAETARDAARAAAWAAWVAGDAAREVAGAAWAARDAAGAAAEAAGDAAGAAAEAEVNKRCCDIIRAEFKNGVKEDI